MSREFNMDKNKHQKVHFRQYLNSFAEPFDDIDNDVPAALEAELVERSYIMRRRLNHVASKIRGRHTC